MRLRLTVVRADQPGEPQEVQADCAPGSTVADLTLALEEPLGDNAPGWVLHAGGAALPPDHPVGSPPLLDGAAVTVAAQPLPAADGRRSAMVLCVTSGPDAGRQLDLLPGSHTLGRSPEADLVIDDPGLSRVHATLDVGPEGIQVADARSTNGTSLDGVRVGAEPVTLDTTHVLALGSSRLRLRSPLARPASVSATGWGTRNVNRSPRPRPPQRQVGVTMPAPPEPPHRTGLPWVTLLVPLPIGALLALWLGPQLLLFAAMGPALLLAHTASERTTSRRRYAAQRRAHAAAVREAQERVQAGLADELRRRRWELPDPAEVLTIAGTPSVRLWERSRSDPDVLTVSVGTCTTAADLQVLRPGQAPAGSGEPTSVDLHQAPCAVALAEAGVLGIAGPRRQVVGSARSVLGQLATLHSPADVSLWLLALDRERGAEWLWLLRLPHCRRADGSSRLGLLSEPGQADAVVAELRALVGVRAPAPQAARWAGEWAVVVVDGAHDLRQVPGLASLLSAATRSGIAFVCLDDTRRRLPPECRSVLDLAGATGPMLSAAGQEPSRDLVVDGVGTIWAERLSRALAPLRDATPAPDRQLPDTVRLLELLRFDALDPFAVAGQWSARPSTTAAVVGRRADAPHVVDLATDGPHVLVGGTTGSGKSELLQTLIASLAVGNRPDHLSFVLVDYKGGAAFRECADLPHTAGLVTDLDQHLTERALASLSAELRRRERILASAGAPDLTALSRGGLGHLPRLVIVVDEFRVLAEELPDFVDGLVRIASVGRSLGVHLVLATQRPAGVVSAAMKANVNLRIALRMRDRADSDDVIEAPDAALLHASQPGRALARVGGGVLTTFQAARVGGVRDAGPELEPVRVAALPVEALGQPRPLGREGESDDPSASGWQRGPDPGAGHGSGSGRPGQPRDQPSDLTALVESLRTAARQLGCRPAPSPWLPPLPAEVVLPLEPNPGSAREPCREGAGDPAAVAAQDSGPPEARHDGRPTDVLTLGLADHPHDQAQRPLVWDLADPLPWAVAGDPGSGRTTFLTTVAAQVAGGYPPGDAHLYVVDASRVLGPLQDLPHTGAVVPHDDVGRLHRLVHRLAAEVAQRQQRLADRGFASVAAWRREAARSQHVPPAPPWMFLLVDGWEAVAEAADAFDHGDLSDALLSLVREGGAAGLRTVVTGGRSLLFGRAAAVLPRRVVLRLGDPADLALAGLPRSAVPTDQPRGRGVLAPSGVEVQVAQSDVGTAALRLRLCPRAEPLVAGGEDDAAVGERRPLRVDALPSRVSTADLLTTCPPAAAEQASGLLAIGLGGDCLGPVGLVPGADGRHFLAAGPPRSGRSTALLALVHALLRARWPLAVVASRRGPLESLRGRAHVAAVVDAGEPSELGALADARRRHTGLAVVVDDADRLLDTPAEPLLREIAALVDRDGGLIACSASTTALATQYRGLAVEVARHRTGVLLGPASPLDGEVFGVRPAVRPGAPPGRGLLVRAGEVVELQVALNPVVEDGRG